MFTNYITREERNLIDNAYPPTDVKGSDKKKELYRLLAQKKAKEHFELFVKLLGYNDTGNFHIPEMARLGECRYIKDKSWRRLWLWSRGFFKTSLITVSHSIYLMVNNPNIRILLVANTLDIAKLNYHSIRSHFTSNPHFRYVFREFCPKSSRDGKIEFGTTEQFTLPNRTKIVREPTIMCAGVNTNLTGLHFDVIKVDDLVTKDSVSNDTQIQASKDYHAYLTPFFDNPKETREDVVGTIYHFNDLYNDLIKSPLFEKSIVPARTPEGQYPFPERVNETVLDNMLNDPNIGPYVVYPQYLLSPFDPSKCKFKEEWLKYYDELPKNLTEYILVDPASTQKKKSDYSVLERWGVDYEGKAYLIEGYRDKFSAFGRIDRLFEMAERAGKNLRWVKYEVLGGRHGDLEVIAQRQRDKQIYFEVKETKGSTSSKVDRIEQRLVPKYHAGVIFWPRNFVFLSYFDNKVQDFIHQLKLEYLQFPATEHDDALDCSAQLFEDGLEIIRGSKPPEPVLVSAGITGKQYHDLIDKKKMGDTRDPWKRLMNIDRRYN